MTNETDVPPGPQTDVTALDAFAQERQELHDRLLRTAAEFENYRKRTDRERRELWEMATSDVLRDLLPAVDDLQRALDVSAARASGADDVEGGIRKGVELIHRQLTDLLRKRGVEPLDVVGKDFDPVWHEAIANDPLEGRRPGEITVEVRRGYRIGEKLLRPAMVKVANA